MITTRELYKWRDEILRTQEEAEKLADNYDQEFAQGPFHYTDKIAIDAWNRIEK